MQINDALYQTGVLKIGNCYEKPPVAVSEAQDLPLEKWVKENEN